MPIQSRWTVPIPEVSVQKWLFGSTDTTVAGHKTFIDADNPDSRFLTFYDFYLLSKRVACGLQQAGLHPGDRVLLMSGNNLHFPCLFMGVLMAGGIFTGASPTFGPTELAFQLQDSGASFMIAGVGHMSVALESASRVGLPRSRIYVYDDSPSVSDEIRAQGVKHWTEFLAETAQAELFEWSEPSDPHSTTCCLNYSSGTTGVPKGVEITHYSYVANGQAHVHLKQQDAQWQGQAETTICFMPMYHAAAQTIFITCSPKMGVSTYIMPVYNFERLLQHVENFGATTLVTAPPVLVSLAKSPLYSEYDLSSIREILCGTAPLSPDIAEQVNRKLWPKGESFIRQGWGMTEITCLGSHWSPEDEQWTTSVGEIVPNACFKIMDGEKEVTKANEQGELWFSGPTLMKGYWRNPQATAETIQVDENGTRWLKTGDVVRVDALRPGAKIQITDRIKELIKVRGFQVSPAELEGTLLDHEKVVDAGVVGVVMDGEEVPRAYIVTRSAATEQEITQWLEKRVAKYKWLRGGVAFVDSIPRIPVS